MSNSLAAMTFRRKEFRARTDKYMQITPVGQLSALGDALRGTSPIDVSGSLMTDPYIQDQIGRLGRYNEYLDLYAGRHHRIPYENGFLKPVFNYPRRIVNKRAAWIAGRRGGFSFVPRRGNESVMEVMDAVWNANNKRSLISRSAKVSLTTGDAFWYVTIRMKDRAGKPLPKSEWSVRICPLNPAFVFPLYVEDDPTSMKACMIQFPIWGDTENREVLFTAVYTPTKVTMYRNLEKTSETANVLGDIPVIHIPNSVFGDMPFGISALHDVTSPLRRYTELRMHIDRIIAFHADPTTIVYGTTLGRMDRAANRVWSNLPPPDQARVENLELKGDLKAMYDQVAAYKNEILEAGCTPQIAFEAEKLATSNSSGIAVQLLFQPLIEVTDEAQYDFSLAISKTNRVIAGIYDKIFGEPLSELSDSKDDFLATDYSWPSMLPRDEAAELDLITKKVELGVISRAEAARRVSGVTDNERNAIEISADVAAELARDLEKARVLQGQPFNPTALVLGSLFMNEDLLDIASELGKLSDNSNSSAGGSEPDDDDTES